MGGRRAVSGLSCVCCGQPAVHLHHVLTRQAIRRAARNKQERTRLMLDEANLVAVCFEDHAAHHNRTRPIELSVLPDSVFTFARKLLGAGPAYEALMRAYSGEDPRLDALLHEWEQAA